MTKQRRTLNVIAGTQFGSEGKGHVTQQVINGYRTFAKATDGNPNHILSVRIGGPNAGHCVIDPDTGHKYALRTIPVGAIYNDTRQYIAPGSEVDLDVLESEIDELLSQGKVPHLTIDGSATWLTPKHIQDEKDSDLNARTGSTAKGIGAARADRIWRTALTIQQAHATDLEFAHRIETMRDKIRQANPNDGYLLIWSTEDPNYRGPFMPALYDDVDQENGWLHVVIEGTQGYGLGLHGQHYPQSTSNDTRAIDFMAMAGTNPWEYRHVSIVGVARTNPIRVAGNSGPLKGESTWEQLGQESERTTVTQKTRRVGEWDGPLVGRAVADGGVTAIALTMADKIIPEIHGIHGVYAFDDLPTDLQHLVTQVEIDANQQVFMVTTSEKTAIRISK